jgi:hypothetical protein
VNTERFRVIAGEVLDEMSSLQLLSNLESLVAGLDVLASQPSDAAAQARISEARTALQALENAPSNEWPASDRQVLDELSISDVLGDRLLASIEEILSRNEITPAVAASEIRPAFDRARSVNASLEAIVAAFNFFGIQPPRIGTDAEIVVAIPRDAVHEHLGELGREFEELWRIIAPFQELMTGSRGDVSVASISSSMFGLELLVIPAMAYGIARAVNEILSVYKNILDIRLARQQLRDSGVPDDALSAVDEHANSIMSTNNEALATTLVAELPVAPSIDEGRKNELAIEIRLSLNAIANRIDKGYEIDIRAPDEPTKDTDEAESSDETPLNSGEQLRFREELRDLSRRLRNFKVEGASILTLPEGPTQEDGLAR